MHLSAKCSGAREPTFADANVILPTVVFGKREEAAKTISDVLQWWEAMALCLPTMYPIARSILAIPHTSCDVERSFSVWKRVRSEKQHKAYVSFCFNGVVPPP